MKITITPSCAHKDGWTSRGQPMTGRHLIVSGYGACLDGVWVIRRDRRAIKNRVLEHPWVTSNGSPDPSLRDITWTTFSVEVEP